MKQLQLPELWMSSFVCVCVVGGWYVCLCVCVFFLPTVLCGVERLQRREIESSHQIKMKCILLTLQNNQGISAGVRKVTQCAK